MGQARVTQAGAYVELGGESALVTQVGAYVELSAVELRVTQVGVYVELIYVPSPVLAAYAVNTGRVDLVWTVTLDDDEIDSFEVQRKLTSGGTYATIAEPPADYRNYVDNGLDEATGYTYRVRVYVVGSPSEWSNEVAITTPATRRDDELRLFLLSPRVVMRARVNQATFNYPLDQVVFDSVTEGDAANITPGMTVLFGLTEGGDDLGRQRVRAWSGEGTPTAGVLTIGRTSRGRNDGEVELHDDAYITVLEDYRVWAKLPHIDPASGEIYKDSRLPVGLRTTNPPPVANAGPPAVGTIDSGTELFRVALPDTANTSFAMTDAATISSYLWVLPSGVTLASGYNLTDSRIVADFPAGFHWVRLQVTDSNGNTHSAWTWVYARDPDNDDSITEFQIASHRRRFDGQEMTVEVFEDLPLSSYPEGTLAVVYEGDPPLVSPPVHELRSNILFWGWVGDEPARIVAGRTGIETGVALELHDVAERLRRIAGFSVSVMDDDLRDEAVEDAITWSYMVNPTVGRYLHYLLHWHTTALEVTDFQARGGLPARAFAVLEAGEDNVWDQAQWVAKALAPGALFTCNTLGMISIQSDMLLAAEPRHELVQWYLSLREWSQVRYAARRWPRVREVRLGGLLAGTDPREDGAALFSRAPGITPGQGAEVHNSLNNLVVSQDQLNTMAGHLYARLNARQSLFEITMTRDENPQIDPAVNYWVVLDMTAEVAAQRGLVFPDSGTRVRGIVREVSIRYDYGRTGMSRTSTVTWERETSGPQGITVTDTWTLPEDPPEE